MAMSLKGGCSFCGGPDFNVLFFLNDLPLSSEKTEHAACVTIQCASCKAPALELMSDFGGHVTARGVSVCHPCAVAALRSLDPITEKASMQWSSEKGVAMPPRAGVYPIGSKLCSACGAVLSTRWWWNIHGFGMASGELV